MGRLNMLELHLFFLATTRRGLEGREKAAMLGVTWQVLGSNDPQVEIQIKIK